MFHISSSIKKIAYAAAFACGLVGCSTATPEGYQRLCEAYRDVSEQTLIDSWGQPDSTHARPGGGEFVRYRKIRTWTVPGGITYMPQQIYQSGTIAIPNFNQATYSGVSSTMVPVRESDSHGSTFCLTDFLIDKTGHVADYKFAGPDCVAELVQ